MNKVLHILFNHILILRTLKIAGGNKLQTTGSKLEEMKSAESVKTTPAATVQTQEVKPDTAAEPVTPTTLAALQSDVQPVGHDYVEEVVM